MVAELSRYLRGWNSYFGYCETPSVLHRLDRWIRRRLALCDLEAVEEWPHAVPGAETAGCNQYGCLPCRLQQPRAVATDPHSGRVPCLTKRLLRLPRTSSTSRKGIRLTGRTAVDGPGRTVVWELRLASA